MRRQTATWLPAIEEALDLPDAELPDLKTPHEGPPPARGRGASATRPRRPGSRPPERRSVRSPSSTGCRSRTCSPRTPYAGWPGRRPDALADDGTDTVAAFLRDHGARAWQVGLTAGVLHAALARGRAADDPTPERRHGRVFGKAGVA